MFSSGSPDKSKRAAMGNRMPPDGKAQTITCQGCGQVGAIEADAKGEPGGHHRRHGFYLHERGTALVVACCKCQQIQSLHAERRQE
jgi:hypothetical protein